VSLERFAIMLNCKFMSFSFVYLGVPIGGNHKSVFFFEGAVRQGKKEVIQVERKTYVYGREGYTLIKLAPSSMFIFLLSIFKVPKSVNNGMIKIQQ